MGIFSLFSALGEFGEMLRKNQMLWAWKKLQAPRVTLTAAHGWADLSYLERSWQATYLKPLHITLFISTTPYRAKIANFTGGIYFSSGR